MQKSAAHKAEDRSSVQSAGGDDRVDLCVNPADEIKTTTCYMCACRCGIRVYLKNGKVRYIEGNRDHPVNKGVLCGKGSAGIMQHYAPSRLRTPLMRVGRARLGRIQGDLLGRGARHRDRAGWPDPAHRPATARLLHRSRSVAVADRLVGAAVRHAELCRARRLLLGQHGGGRACTRSAARSGSSVSRTGTHTNYFMLFGVAEDHASNPIKIGLGKLKERGAKIVAINPVRTGYGAIADEWVGIKPGTDGLFVGALDP